MCMDEVIQNLYGIKSYLVTKSCEKSNIPKEALEITKVAFMESIKTIDCTINLLREQEETIKNLEQEIRDKNERLKERAEQVDSMLKEQEAQRDYEASVDYAEYCERYERTYNQEDGSM